MDRFLIRVGSWMLLVGLLATPGWAQVTLRAGHAGGGHAEMRGGTFALRGTSGQPATAIRGADPFLGEGFWYAARNDRVALPVELTHFAAETDGDRVRLTWQTASETGNAGFHVERRVERRGTGGARPEDAAFRAVRFVKGAGTTTAPQTYRFADATLPFDAERVTYRLRQIDLDGSASYSGEVTVGRSAPDRLVLHALYPNPTRGTGVTLRYVLPEAADVSVTVYDVLGREVARPVARRQRAGRTELHLSLPRLGSGLYFVRLTAGAQAQTRRLTVVR